MPKIVQILLLILLPLAWGLGTEYLFELVRRRRRRHVSSGTVAEGPFDWVI